ncbi:translational GTPase TypA [Candidatus Gottesmanbacteria bacterium CG11_big_fil_rev_8_21_14_0_20_37_11]|uniref:50S ribosomal subunit assembly factor BipA n=3 Tax=Candidatus Gottesmaniibacteriota TaxID=1752720 RepID=A0A2M7RRB1_9BACT|nr:MAG: GTP-binding protein TypA [Candidatus Gottesmanbacteria bacterium CG1_02_37_22]PIP32923.1 MAG: translational GTPase TypA [Candidatus Gottesmanbacteria bacterium CG23_combo_of_CG06-09_8_20_14_all_37_19]PIR08003.1 MAG: translational GTPase TypA [Candidatus Gottesmanbacteria bacterium CG11_big_fil_rev_8_21_14_0_20_37_11]PIZ02514.1 MAG: translational GTPase TypA [Candidatus Gottesmanbacteria bacterium CG_4_10_14_0_8_um_filter_37_24]
MQIRNIAIIAHVDHGKTTLVDAMLKQTHTFRDNQKEMGESLIMDSNDLEKEKGITILSKNTSVYYKNTKINIIDTPGHADFGGEVERVLNMASGALLLIDASEGPLPQTKFVLRKAMQNNLKIILVINKIDKKDARVKEVIRETENLFLDIASQDSALNYSTIYAVGRDGKAFTNLPEIYSTNLKADLAPIFDIILKVIQDVSKNTDKPFQMLVSTLDYDNYVGRLCIGKVNQGVLKRGESIVLVEANKILGKYICQKLYTSVGLERKETEEVTCGDIIAIAGIPDLTIGQTVTTPSYPVSLPKITTEDPTIKITIGPNTSPLSGRDGKFVSSAQIKSRLLREKDTNLGLRIEEGVQNANFTVAGRGELHLAILLETMRREGFELEVSKPQVIYKMVNGIKNEPFEEITIDIDNKFIGVITEEMGIRKAEMVNMIGDIKNTTRLVFKISSRNLLGLRGSLLTKTKGTVLLSTYFLGYFPVISYKELKRNGVLIATHSGMSLSFGLENAQKRGILFIGPSEEVYEGMITGVSNNDLDVEINVCKAKKQTNVRSETADIAIQLTPPTKLDIEQALDFINEDELIEITPKIIRLRKKYLSATKRKVMDRKTVSHANQYV